MLSTFERVLEQIEENRGKKYNCIPFQEKLPRFSEYCPGIEKKKYYLVSGASGSGKSQFVDEFFVFNALDHVLSNKTNVSVKIKYYSFELDAETKVKQWIRKRLYDVYGLRISDKIINSIGDYRMTDDILMAVKETQEYFKNASKYIDIIDSVKTSEEIIKDMENFALSTGTVHTKPDGSFDRYEPDEEDQYVIWIVDHYSLLKLGPRETKKTAIDNLSQGFVAARNKYGYIPVPVQQISAEGENAEHFKLSKLEPSKDVLSDSKQTFNDCDTALGIFNPYKHEIKSYRGYNTFELGDNYRNLSVFKNRYGQPYVNTGVYFDGCVGFWKELPHGKEMNSSHYEMVKKKKPNW